MMNQETTQAILSLKEKGVALREISRILRVSRNTVRRVLRGKGHESPQRASRYEELASLIEETLRLCKAMPSGSRRFLRTPMDMISPTVRLHVS